MNKAIHILGFLFFSLSVFQSSAQEKAREVYLRTQGSEALSFLSTRVSLEFKNQLKENTFLRVKAQNFTLNSGSIYSPGDNRIIGRNYQFNIAGGIGLEKRKQLNDKLTFFHGPCLNNSFSLEIADINNTVLNASDIKNESFNNSTSLSYNLGMYAELKEWLVIAFQYEPYVSYYFRQASSSGTVIAESNLFNSSFGPSNASLLIGVRWHKKPKHQSSKTEEPTPAK